MRIALALTAVLALAACKQDKGGPSNAPGAEGVEGARGGPPGDPYAIEVVAPAGCAAGAACTLEVKLKALGPYHVNREYPFKFVPATTDGVTHDDGVFAIDDDRTGTLKVNFRAAAPGQARVEGTFKLSVCSEDTCEIEAAPVSADVPVT